MSRDYDKTQLMIVENFRKWQEQEINEQSTKINEDMTVDDWRAIWDWLGLMITFWTSAIFVWRASSPWLKIVATTSSGQAAFKAFPKYGDTLLAAVQTTDTLADAIRVAGEQIKQKAGLGFYYGPWAVYVVTFVAFFPLTEFLGIPVFARLAVVGAGEGVRIAGKTILKAKSIFGKVKKDIEADRKKEIEELEKDIEQAAEAAGMLASELKKVLLNPEKYDKRVADAAPAGEAPEIMGQKKSKAQKVTIPKKPAVTTDTSTTGDSDED